MSNKNSRITENDFLKIISAGMQHKLKIGTEVKIPNRYGITDIWVVADVNHDNTEKTVDLISKDLLQDYTSTAYDVGNGGWGSSHNYNTSTIRGWLNYVFITGFSGQIRTKLKPMVVETDVNNEIVTTNDKVKLLSATEIGIDNTFYSLPLNNEGSLYPIFINGNDNDAKDRRIKISSKGVGGSWWCRTKYLGIPKNICYICENGNYRCAECNDGYKGIVTTIRF